MRTHRSGTHGDALHRRTAVKLAVVVTAVAVAVAGLPLAGGARGATAIVVAPNGSSTGDGSLAKPLSLAAALATSSPARPGDEIVLRGGVYRGAFYSRISGTTTQPIVVRSYPNEWAVFDGGTLQMPSLTITGSDVWFRDFEVTKSDPKRISSQAGAGPRDISRGNNGSYTQGDGIIVAGPRVKLINLVVHDAGNGIVTLKGAVDSEIYGAVLYNNGFLSTDRAWGHAIYLHNDVGTKTVADSVMFNNWALGLQAADMGNVKGVVAEGITSFGNGTPVDFPRHNILFGPGSSGTLDRISVDGNVGYHDDARGDNVRLGFAHDTVLRQNGSVRVDGNVVVGGKSALVLQGWKSAVVRNNTVAVDGRAVLAKVFTNAIDGADYVWDQNKYVDLTGGASGLPPAFARYKKTAAGWTGSFLTFQNWVQSTGYDGTSAFGATSEPLRTIVRPNRYEAGRAFVTVLNHARSDSVALELEATGLKLGQAFQIHDVQHLTGAPVATGTYDGSAVSVPMNSSDVMQSIGGSPAPVRHTSSRFGVFLVRPVS